jgi:phosphate transport system substrate-binding protein
MLRLTSTLAAAFVVPCLVVTACGGSQSAGQPIVIDGSSTVFPISDEAAREFRGKHPQQTVNVTSSSTGVGLKRFCAGELDFANASRPITPVEAAACAAAQVEFVEIPIAYDAISIVVNRANAWAKSITVRELKRLWEPQAERRVMRWNQVRAEWPNREIHLVGPDNESGTFDYFNEAINGAPKSSRKDYTGHADYNKIVEALERDELALGYVGFTYAEQHKERLLELALDDLDEQVGIGAIEPSATNVQRGIYRPLSRPLLVYVRAASLDRPEVQQFADFYTRFEPDIVQHVGGIRLAPREAELAIARLKKRVRGSMFGAEQDHGLSLQLRLSKYD